MRKALIVAAICAVAVLGAPAVQAFCPSPTPMANLSATPVINCPDGKPLIAYAFQLSNPSTINTGTTDIVCEVNGVQGCTTMPGTNLANDNVVGLETDWGNPTIVGCPNGRIAIVLQCADGSGGILSLSGNCPEFFAAVWSVEAAFPFDASSGLNTPLDMGPTPAANVQMDNGRARLSSPISRNGGMDTVMFHVEPPTIQSDCSPGSLGEALLGAGLCADLGCGAAPPTVARGKAYSSTQPCADATARPDLRRQNSCTAGSNPVGTLCTTLGPNTANCGTGGICSAPPFPWTAVAYDDLGTGNGSVMLPTPTNGNCNYLGTTSVINGSESNLITGYVMMGSPTAASPVAEAVRVVRKGGSIEVTFKTSSELGLAGFNVLAAGKAKGGELKLNAGLVSATGVGGAGSSYRLTYAVGDLKGNRGVIVESVLTDGSTLRAPLVEF